MKSVENFRDSQIHKQLIQQSAVAKTRKKCLITYKFIFCKPSFTDNFCSQVHRTVPIRRYLGLCIFRSAYNTIRND